MKFIPIFLRQKTPNIWEFLRSSIPPFVLRQIKRVAFQKIIAGAYGLIKSTPDNPLLAIIMPAVQLC